MRSFHRFLLPAVFCAALFPVAAAAQDGVMKACGEKWQAAKAAGTATGTTWTKFLAECRAGTPAAAGASAAEAAPSKGPSSAARKDAGADAAAGRTPVFPGAVSPKFADLRPSRARQKTCSEQYQANKATGGNAGLRWLEKGGGYWSLCNKRLKGA